MKIAFVSFTGMPVGGIPVYMSRLADGFVKNGNTVKFVLVSKGSGKGLINTYTTVGVDKKDCIVASDVKSAVSILKKFDWVIYDQAGGYGDLKYSKHHDEDDLPWYYDVIYDNYTPSCAFIHSTTTYNKHSPYLDIWEEVCEFFAFNCRMTANDYLDVRGELSDITVDVVPVPIDCDNIPSKFPQTYNLIASTNRIDPVKRIHLLVEAASELENWGFEMYSGENIWHYIEKIVDMIEDGTENIFIDIDSKLLDYDKIFKHVALVYGATKLDWGAAESSVLEGVVRGAVPLLTPQWVYPPNKGAFPENACYKFEPDVASLVNVMKSVDINGNVYKRKRLAAIEFVRTHKADRVVARRMEKWLK